MGRWKHAPILPITLILTPGLIALIGLAISHIITICALSVLIVFLLIDRFLLFRAMRALVGHLQAGQFDTKLEVGAGVWGEVCHAINRILQQWRTAQHIQRLQPTQPALQHIDPLTLHPPVDGQLVSIAVLAIGRSAISDPITEIRAFAHLIHESAERQQALIQWHSDHILLIFGALSAGSDPIRQAIAATNAITTAALATGLPQPSFALSAGIGRVAVVPLLGLYVTGTPLEQASSLVRQSEPDILMCSEEASFQLRNTGLATLSGARLVIATRNKTLERGAIQQYRQPE
ncbi:DUF3329 domain-containing protein [Chloroflexus sp.]|uniref:DUF3329 domain-containing protein n=1 Tax=Chloroflexus sp. TaxID=1904827 RepID=UPI0026171A01|nr:DUF3329 domain-containing protein [uncultured Chloroflexus sp.]